MTTEFKQSNPASKRPRHKRRSAAAMGRSNGRATKAPRRTAVRLAQIALFWERLWPVLLVVAAPLFLVIVASLFNIWSLTPFWTHWLALGAAAIATVMVARQFIAGLRWPNRDEAQQRLERDGGVQHAPLRALEDAPFESEANNPLWRAHQRDMEKRARAAQLRGPAASAGDVDPLALRFGALGLFVVALVAAGDDAIVRVTDGFIPKMHSGETIADLWIEPPAYTGGAPIYLARAGQLPSGAQEQLNAPAGSIVIAQLATPRRYRLTFKTPSEEFESAAVDTDNGARAHVQLNESGVIRFRLGGRDVNWPVGVVEDRAPVVSFSQTPASTDDARLAIAVRVDDDYGLAEAVLRLKLDPDQPRPLDSPDFDARTANETRLVTLDGLAGPLDGGAFSERRFDLDLQSDPWAGLNVIAVLAVKDGAGQSAETEEEKFTLPAKAFYNPLARAVIEQRQTLAVAASQWRRTGRSFDALTLAPSAFYDSTTDYLLMRTAFWRVMRHADNPGDDEDHDFSNSVEAFWPLALQLEDEALELARRRLEAAQQALREALENGANDQEIERLTENLRSAMQDYLQALAQSGQRNASNGPRPDQTLDQADLDRMLDSIRDMAKSGAQNAARQALSDLENLLNNLRLSGQSSGEGQQQGQAGENGQAGEGGGQSGGAAGQAGDLIGRQRDLANQSFERGQTQGENGDDLAQGQGDLADDLSSMMEELEGAAGRSGQSIDPDGAAERALGDALSEMRRAEDALVGDNFSAANSAMERAIANLREGAQALADEQGRQDRQARGEGQGDQPGVARDPLGRPVGEAYGQGVDVPEESDAQRARAVLEELRKRLSDGDRSEEEIDYLERLLERF